MLDSIKSFFTTIKNYFDLMQLNNYNQQAKFQKSSWLTKPELGLKYKAMICIFCTGISWNQASFFCINLQIMPIRRDRAWFKWEKKPKYCWLYCSL